MTFSVGTNNSAELYDPSTASFTLTAYPNDERDGRAQAVVLGSGLPLVMGGYGNYHVYRPIYWNTAEIFNATTPNFTLSATPASQTVTQGNATRYTLTVTPSNGFAGMLTVTTTSLATPGTYTIVITGTSGSLSHSTSVTLTVNGRRGG